MGWSKWYLLQTYHCTPSGANHKSESMRTFSYLVSNNHRLWQQLVEFYPQHIHGWLWMAHTLNNGWGSTWEKNTKTKIYLFWIFFLFSLVVDSNALNLSANICYHFFNWCKKVIRVKTCHPKLLFFSLFFFFKSSPWSAMPQSHKMFYTSFISFSCFKFWFHSAMF